jgi:hypothetical protein
MAQRVREFEGFTFEVCGITEDVLSEMEVSKISNGTVIVENDYDNQDSAKWKVYLKVIGFRDPLSPSKDWGVRKIT